MRVGGSRNSTAPMARPATTPTTKPMVSFTITSSRTQPPSQLPTPAEPAAAMAMAAFVNGKASPSFNPASDVRLKRTSSSSSLPGGPTCTSLASTGSVGASAAPSRRAEAGTSPAAHQPSMATPPIVRGMARISSRHVVRHDDQPTWRSILSPAPISDTITASSVSRSTTSPSARGSIVGRRSGRANTAIPRAT